jgi:hypothetical protein
LLFPSWHPSHNRSLANNYDYKSVASHRTHRWTSFGWRLINKDAALIVHPEHEATLFNAQANEEDGFGRILLMAASIAYWSTEERPVLILRHCEFSPLA